MMTEQIDLRPRPGQRAPRALIWLVKIVVSVGLLYVLFSRVDVGAAVDRRAARRRSPWLAGALVLYFVMVLVSAWRWGLLLRAQHVRLPFGFLTQSFLVATFFNNFLPSNIGGDVIRITDTAKTGRIEDAGDDGGADRPRHRPARAGVRGRDRRDRWRRADAPVGPVGPGMLWAVFGVGAIGRDAGAADAGGRRRGCCGRCACFTRNGSTRGSRS